MSAPAIPGPPLLAVRDVTKAFGGVVALRGVSFELRAGEVHALVGENGAGKSTLIKIVTGAHRPDVGSLALDGRELPQLDPEAARRLGIAVIYQQPALLPDLTVAENIGLALEAGGPLGRVRWAARRAQAVALLDRVGAAIDPDAPVSSLTMPEQQLVEIAKAVGARARVLIMDEPTASLSEKDARNLLRVIGELRAAGAGIIYISHRLEELPGLADRVTALRDGRLVGTVPMASIDRAGLIKMMVGRELDAVFPKRTVTIGSVRLALEGVSCAASGVCDVSLTIGRGEIFGLAGLVGAGRTELARTLFGLTPASGGRILVDGQAVRLDSPAVAIAAGLAYVPEDRRRHGVILDMSVAANTGLASLRGLYLDVAAEARVAKEQVERLGVKTPSIDTPVGHLSGGNQQKVALGRWLATQPRVLILDEPTQGIDVGAKSEIHRLMGELAAQGMAILMISSELPELLGMCDRIGVMRQGRLAGVLDRAAATQEKLLALALGGEAARAA
jgi:rhamnose transport system ATP-binding protein